MFIGILTVQNPQGFSGNKRNFRDIIRAGQKRKIDVAVVPAEGINFTLKRCDAYIWDSVWKQTSFPLPDVMYNRISTRAAESQMHVVKTKRRLKRVGIPFYNESFFNKWELYKLISQDPLTNRLLPDTRVLNHRNLQTMLHEFEQVYIKPVHSKAGKGIIRLDLIGQQVTVNQQLKGKRLMRQAAIPAIVKRLHADSRFGEYLIQQAVPLAQAEGRSYDLRTLVQKDNTGKWVLTGVGARVAPMNGIMTHVPNGGMIRPVSDVLQETFGEKASDILNDVQDKVILLANVLEQGLPGIVGEMSIDIGIDHSAEPWFFEANAKPMKFDEPEIRSLSLQRTLDYCEFLVNTKE